MIPDLATRPEAPLAAPSIESIIASAVQSGRPASELTELLAFARQLHADKARQEFSAAMAEFKRTCPKVRRRTENPQFMVTRDGVKRAKLYASLADIDDAIGPALSAAGLSYSWTDGEIVGTEMKVGCIVRHAGGYEADPRYVSFPLESQAGASAQQKRASVIEYCRRYSIKNALGLTDTDDDDNDGNAETGETITEEQAFAIHGRLQDCGANIDAFLKFMGVAKTVDILASDLPKALAAIAKKEAAKKPPTTACPPPDLREIGAGATR